MPGPARAPVAPVVLPYEWAGQDGPIWYPGGRGRSISETGDERALEPGASRLIQRAGLALVIQMTGAAAAYGSQILLARLLKTSAYGIYSYVFVWASFASLLAGLGFPYASVRFLPVYRARRDWARLRGFKRTTTRMTFATGIGMAALGIAAALVLHTFAVKHSEFLALGALVVPPLAVATLYQEMARAAGRVGVAFAPPLVARPVLIAVGVTGLFLLHGSLSASVALLTSVVAGWVVVAGQYILTRNLFRAPTARHESVSELREWLGVGVSLLASSAFSVTLMQTDIVVVGAFRGSYDAGLYSAASKTALLVAFVLMAVNAASAPRFATLWASGRTEDLQQLLSRLAKVIFWPSLLIAIGIAALSGPLLRLFGPAFDTARPVLLILVAGQVVNAGAGSVGYLLNLTGHHKEAVRALACSALICVLMALGGVWAFGMVGAALASMLGLLLWNGWLYWLVVEKLGVYPSIVKVGRRRRPRSADTGST